MISLFPIQDRSSKKIIITIKAPHYSQKENYTVIVYVKDPSRTPVSNGNLFNYIQSSPHLYIQNILGEIKNVGTIILYNGANFWSG